MMAQRAQRAGPPAVRGVTVVVVTYNSAGVVGPCLESLPAALGGLPHEVVVVDNDSSDETLTVVRAASAPS